MRKARRSHRALSRPSPSKRATGGELAAIGVLTLFGLRLGLRPIDDNSMLLHMRTGIDIVGSGHIPHRDAYSFTAAGHHWIVQSWLAEATYGAAHRLGGFHAVVAEQGLLMGGLALAIALLARTGAGWRTAVAAPIAVLAGMSLWSPRPLLFGLLAMALLVMIVERRWSPWWIVPVVWIWVNTHGSFPFAVAYLGARYVGTWLDDRARPAWLDRYGIAAVVGLVLSAINPFGPSLLTFPLVAAQDRSVFKNIAEWKSPNFQSSAEFVFAALMMVGLAILIRRRAPWGDLLPLLGFLFAGLVSERNLAVAAVLLAPALGRALAHPGEVRPRADGLPPVAVPACVVAGIALVVIGWRSDPLNLKTYPTEAQAFLTSHGLLSHRMAAFDLVGDYEGFVQGAHHEVFIDDRYDMYPSSVVHDSLALQAGQGGALTVLDKWNIDLVLWRRAQGPTDIMGLTGKWREIWGNPQWEIFERT